jgi:hypothetical protein
MEGAKRGNCCRNCAAWDLICEDWSFDNLGECHRRAPVARLIPSKEIKRFTDDTGRQKIEVFWPIVSRYDWCCEWSLGEEIGHEEAQLNDEHVALIVDRLMQKMARNVPLEEIARLYVRLDGEDLVLCAEEHCSEGCDVTPYEVRISIGE